MMAHVSLGSSLFSTADDVFASIGRFEDLPNLLPNVIDFEVKPEGGQLVRTFKLKSKKNPSPTVTVAEQLIEQRADGYSYRVLSGAPVVSLESTLTITELFAGSSVEWAADFEPESPGDITAIFGLLSSGIANVSSRFNGMPPA